MTTAAMAGLYCHVPQPSSSIPKIASMSPIWFSMSRRPRIVHPNHLLPVIKDTTSRVFVK